MKIGALLIFADVTRLRGKCVAELIRDDIIKLTSATCHCVMAFVPRNNVECVM